MNKHRFSCVTGLVWFFFSHAILAQKVAGSLEVNSGIQPGYTLFTSLNTKNTYLIDNCGNVINSWQSQYVSGSSAYLMKNGNLVRAASIPNATISRAGGGGAIEIMDWDSKLVGYFEYNSSTVRQHHDIAVMDNGNVLLFAWQLHTKEEAIAAGRDPNRVPDGILWAEEIVEMKPIYPSGSEIVWRWSLWDHLVQDFDTGKSNYGIVSDHPELVDINFTAGGAGRDWVHLNAIDYNAELDQIVVCTPFFNEFWIIDHSTTTVEAATHAGGKSNKGGDILFRWGNPITYKKGTSADKVLGGQHHAHWIKKGLPQAGKIMLFNNNAGPNYSSVEIIEPKVESSGSYSLVNGRFEIAAPTIVHKVIPPQNLYSSIMSGVEMLPNGNLLVCPSLQGRLVELKPNLDTAWLYKSPITANGIAGKDFVPVNSNFSSDPSFRAIKYPPNHPALSGKDLTPGSPLEASAETGPEECDPVDSTTSSEVVIRTYPNPVNRYLCVEAAGASDRLYVRLIDLQGREVASKYGYGAVQVSTAFLPDGPFIVSVNGKSIKIVKQGKSN